MERDPSRNFSYLNQNGQVELVQRLIVPSYLVKYLVLQKKLISKKEKDFDSKVSVLKETDHPLHSEQN